MMTTSQTQAHEFRDIPNRVLKKALAGCSKRSRCGAREKSTSRGYLQYVEGD